MLRSRLASLEAASHRQAQALITAPPAHAAGSAAGSGGASAPAAGPALPLGSAVLALQVWEGAAVAPAAPAAPAAAEGSADDPSDSALREVLSLASAARDRLRAAAGRPRSDSDERAWAQEAEQARVSKRSESVMARGAAQWRDIAPLPAEGSSIRQVIAAAITTTATIPSVTTAKATIATIAAIATAATASMGAVTGPPTSSTALASAAAAAAAPPPRAAGGEAAAPSAQLMGQWVECRTAAGATYYLHTPTGDVLESGIVAQERHEAAGAGFSAPPWERWLLQGLLAGGPLCRRVAAHLAAHEGLGGAGGDGEREEAGESAEEAAGAAAAAPHSVPSIRTLLTAATGRHGLAVSHAPPPPCVPWPVLRVKAGSTQGSVEVVDAVAAGV